MDEEYTSRRYGRQSNSGGSKLRSLLRSPASRYSDWGNDALIGLLEQKVAEQGIGSDTKKLIAFLETEIDINYNTLTPLVSIAYGEAEHLHDDYDFTSTALVRRVLEKTRELEWNTQNPTDIADVMDWLIKNEGVPLSAEGRRREQQRADAKEEKAKTDYINSVVQNICRGKAAYPVWSASHGKVINADAALLHSLAKQGTPEAVAELERIDRETAALRQQRGMDKDQQREILHEAANQNRTGFIDQRFTSDHKPKKVVGFDNRPKTIDLDREQPRPYSENPTDSPIRGSAVNASFAAEPSFVSVVTGKEITKAEAIALAKNNLAAFRVLSKKDPLRLNRILAQ
jgi:hypothetical protein